MPALHPLAAARAATARSPAGLSGLLPRPRGRSYTAPPRLHAGGGALRLRGLPEAAWTSASPYPLTGTPDSGWHGSLQHRPTVGGARSSLRCSTGRRPGWHTRCPEPRHRPHARPSRRQPGAAGVTACVALSPRWLLAPGRVLRRGYSSPGRSRGVRRANQVC